jgi:HEAT repeat protein
VKRRLPIGTLVLLLLAPILGAHSGEWMPQKPVIPYPNAPKKPMPGERPGGGTPPGSRATSPDSGAPTGWDRWWALNRERLVARKARTVPADREVVLAALRPLVAHPDVHVRTSAIIALGRAGDSRIAPVLRKLLDADGLPSSVAESAVLALGLIGGGEETSRALAGVLSDEDRHAEIRIFAALALALSGDAAADPSLLSRLGPAERDAGVRSAAAIALGLRGLDRAVPALAKALEGPEGRDPSPQTRSYAAAALGALGGGHARNALHRTLADYDQRIGRQAALGLGAIGTGKARNALRWAFASQKDPLLRAFAGLALAEAGDVAVYEGLSDAAKKGDSVLAAHAALALGLLAGRTTDAEVRGKVHFLLANRMSDVTGPEMFGALAIGAGLAKAKNAAGKLRARFANGKHPRVRGHAAFALALLGEKAATLRPALDAKTPLPLFLEVATALAIRNDREAEKRLRSLAGAEGPESIRAAAIVSLGLFRPAADETVKALVALLGEKKEPTAVRACAAVGLGRLLERESPSKLSFSTLRLTPQNASGPLKEILSMR